MDYKPNEKLEVYWLDAVMGSSWERREDAIKRPKKADSFTLGYFLHKDDEFIYLASSIGTCEDSEVGSVASIPLGMIKTIKAMDVRT